MNVSSRWLDPVELPGHAAWKLANILDVRPADGFARGHLLPAVNLPLAQPSATEALPSDALLNRQLPSILLPPRREPLVVVASQPALAARICDHLARRGRTAVYGCKLDRRDLARVPAELVTTGPGRRHLWRPPDFLVAHAELLPPPAAGPVVDLACGSCRAAVWLAERGYRVTAVDQQRSGLDLGRRLAAASGVSVRFLQRDLRDAEQLPRGPWSVALIMRYLERPLLKGLADLLLPGGVACVRSFRQVEGRSGLPARRHCFEPQELLSLFPVTDYRILVHAEDEGADGLPAAGIVAERRGCP